MKGINEGQVDNRKTSENSDTYAPVLNELHPQSAPSRVFGKFRHLGEHLDLFAVMTAAIVALAIAGSATVGKLVTSAGRDQRDFHYPDVTKIVRDFPSFDLNGLSTATGPLYHVAVATLAGPLHLNEGGTQFVAGLFSVALAFAVARYTRSLPSFALRVIGILPLLTSVYFWQSALWMLTDNAALLFVFCALAVIIGNRNGASRQILVGILAACAVATRQNSVWILVPIFALYAFAYWSDREPRRLKTFVRAVARTIAPSVVTLALLLWTWRGLTPPAAAAYNAQSISLVAPSYVAAVAAIFFVPILLCCSERPLSRRSLRLASVSAICAALPAAIFPSMPTSDSSRRGGLIWSAVDHMPAISSRSVGLIVLSAAGGASLYLVCARLDPALKVIVGTSAVAMSVTGLAAAQLFQKYVELPMAGLSILVIVAIFGSNRWSRKYPLLLLYAAQLAVVIEVVLKPLIKS